MDRALTIIRDVVCLFLGAWAFVYQVTHEADWVRMSGAIAMIGGPAMINAWLRARGASTSEPSPASPVEPRSGPQSSPRSSVPIAGADQ